MAGPAGTMAGMYLDGPSGMLAASRVPCGRSLRDGDPAGTAAGYGTDRGTGVVAIAATAVGVVGLSAAFGFSASLGYLLATPRLYGVTWTRSSPMTYSAVHAPPAQHRRRPAVAAWSGPYAAAPLTINGTAVGGVTTGPGPDGSLPPSTSPAARRREPMTSCSASARSRPWGPRGADRQRSGWPACRGTSRSW